MPTPTNTPTAPAGGNAAPIQSVTLQNLIRTQDASGDILILGEAVTTSPSPLAFVKVTCTFKNAAGAILGTDLTYIVGRVVKITSIDTNTNTALSAGDTGYFNVLTSGNNATVSSYSCEPTFNVSPSSAPSARLEVHGAQTVTSDFRGNNMYVGSAKNTGIKPLIFGQVYAATFSKTGALLDLSFDYISGQTGVTSVGTTDTALDVERTGTFSVNTSASFAERGTTTYLYGWQDVNTLGGTPAAGLTIVDQLRRMSHEELHALRNREIEDMKNMLGTQ